MHETLQNGLPGGSIGTDTANAGNHNRWVRRGWGSDENDGELKRTSLRWQAGAWYVVTAGNVSENRRGVRKAVRRSGPYNDIAEAEARVAVEAGGTADNLEVATQANERQEAIDAVMHEGLVQRLYEAGNHWTLVSGARQETLASNGRDIGAAWERQAVLDFHEAAEFPDLESLHDEVVQAAEVYRRWREGD